MRRQALFLAATVTVAGCLWQGQVSNPFEEGAGGSGTIKLIVQNHNYNQATIKALGRSQRRIGVVSGNSKKSFDLFWPNVDQLVLEIDVLAGSRFRTNSISMEPGESATLYIHEVPSLSSLVRGG